MDTDRCALCDRPLGRAVQKHHVVPKSKGGRETVPVHPICHRKIHKQFSETELARMPGGMADLRADEDMQKFIKWVRKRPVDFYKRTR